MPPHCDSLDGPVVTAARRALDEGDAAIVLPYVPAHAEAEVTAAFQQVLPIRWSGGSVGELADHLFFETVVRLHRAGEGASYTGLKPAGQDEGPVIPVAERALHTGSADELIHVLTEVVADQVKFRLDRAIALKQHEHGSVAAARVAGRRLEPPTVGPGNGPQAAGASLGCCSAGVRRGDAGPTGVGTQAVPGRNQRPPPQSVRAHRAVDTSLMALTVGHNLGNGLPGSGYQLWLIAMRSSHYVPSP